MASANTPRLVAGSTIHGRMTVGPMERERCAEHPRRWRIYRWEWPTPEDGDHVASMEGDSEPVVVRECAECLAQAEVEARALLEEYP